METSIRNKTALLYAYWRDVRGTSAEYRATSFFVLSMSLWIAAAIALILSFSHGAPLIQSAVSYLNSANLDASEQVSYQQFADRYKDPACNYFLGQE